MNEKFKLWIVLFVTLISFSFLSLKLYKNEVLNNVLTNYSWKDDWDDDLTNNEYYEPEIPININEKEIIVGTYYESLEKAKENKKNVLVFFMADWCRYCKQMKSETLSDEKVLNLMKKYIVVYLDVDSNKEIVRKFNIEGLPSYVIVDEKESQVKLGTGFMNPIKFSHWIGDLKFF